MTRFSTLTLLAILCLNISTAQTNLGSGSYYNGAPGPNATEGPLVTSNFDQKIITTDWWTSILWSKWQNPAGFSNIVHPHPFSYLCQSGGLGIGYAKDVQIINGNVGTSFDNNYTHAYNEDLRVGLSGVTFSETKAESYSDWDVLANWTSGNDVLRAKMGHGFTYTYFTKEGSADIAINTSGSGSKDGNVLRITANGKHFAVFAPTGATWSGSGSSFTTDLDGKDYLSVALLPDGEESTFQAFAANAFAFIEQTTVDFSIDDQTGQITTNFNVTYDNKEGDASETFFALYRHQWQYTDQVNTDYTYESPRGTMKVVQGPNFSTSMQNIGALPLLPHADNYDDATLSNLVQEFASRASYNCQGAGCNTSFYGNYTFGRFMIQAGQVALLAEQIGDMTSANKISNWIKLELEDFFNYNDGNSHYVGYNDTWDITLINGDNIEHCSIECLNDRHLQYGYWVRAAAIVEHFNPGWHDDWGEMVELLIRDVSNTDRNDDMFPFMRNYDVYAGHSWALGFSDLVDGADQESSSESLNFASGLLFWGQETGNQDLIDRAMWMYTTEVVATEQYWFDVEQAVFPEGYYPEMVGLNRSAGGFYQLWWELRPEHVLMVNSFPWTGAATYLGRYPDAAQRVYEWIETGAGNNGHGKWWGYMWPYLALYNPDKAIQEYNSISYDWAMEFEAQANVYYWLHTLQSNGTVDRTISANLPSATVFDKDGVKKYGVYNPEDQQVTIDFTNGKRFVVPANTLTYFTDDDAVSIEDCNGVAGGEAFIDDCDQCVGGNTGKEACPVDCSGEPNGEAYLDNCDQCVGGNTGKTACIQDCNDEWGGTAFVDECDVCVEGSTGEAACFFDCNGDENGAAYLDACDQCVGGNTGEVSCLSAYFTADTYHVNQGGTVTFIDQSDGGIDTWHWDFGSAGTQSGAGPHTITFSNSGIVEVTLTVSAGNAEETYSRNINVIASPDCNAAYSNDFDGDSPTVSSNKQLTPAATQNTTSSAMSGAVTNGILTLTSNGAEYASAIMSLDGSFDMTSNPVLGLRVKGSEAMALRVTVRDQNKTVLMSDNLMGAATTYEEGSFDLPVTTEWQVFEIDFSGEMTDQWIRPGNGATHGSIQDIQFIPNPTHNPALGFSQIFEGTIDIDYIVLGGDVNACFGGQTDCFGVTDGTASIDECGWCTGGETGVEPCQLDCNNDPNGSAAIDACQICAGGNTGIEPDNCIITAHYDEPAASKSFGVYPSPTTSSLIVTGADQQDIIVMDLTGKIWLRVTPTSDAFQLNLIHLPPAVYQVKMGLKVQKVVKL